MTDPMPPSSESTDEPRRPWRKPEMTTILAIDETATGTSTGNDGNGATTGS
jgi:hypothetical protein